MLPLFVEQTIVFYVVVVQWGFVFSQLSMTCTYISMNIAAKPKTIRWTCCVEFDQFMTMSNIIWAYRLLFKLHKPWRSSHRCCTILLQDNMLLRCLIMHDDYALQNNHSSVCINLWGFFKISNIQTDEKLTNHKWAEVFDYI